MHNDYDYQVHKFIASVTQDLKERGVAEAQKIETAFKDQRLKTPEEHGLGIDIAKYLRVEAIKI